MLLEIAKVRKGKRNRTKYICYVKIRRKGKRCSDTNVGFLWVMGLLGYGVLLFLYIFLCYIYFQLPDDISIVRKLFVNKIKCKKYFFCDREKAETKLT